MPSQWNSRFSLNNQTVKRGAGRALMAVFCILVALMIALGAAASTFLPVYAAEYTAYDRSAIEDDLKEIDVSMYPQSDDLRHRLLDEVGFMEYAYSESPFMERPIMLHIKKVLFGVFRSRKNCANCRCPSSESATSPTSLRPLWRIAPRSNSPFRTGYPNFSVR